MKKAPNPTSVGGKKSPATSNKKSRKRLSPDNLEKPRKHSSVAKSPAIKKGCLSELRPPRPHEIKSIKPNPLISILPDALKVLEPPPRIALFDRFYDRPDYYIAYGAFYLTIAIYLLKLHHRPLPLAAIKVLEDAVEDITQKKSELLAEWGLSPEDARRVVESSNRAWLLDFSKRIWGCNNPDEILSNEKMRERAMIVSSKHDWTLLLKTLQLAFISKSAEFDLPDFVKRLNRAVKEKRTGFESREVGSADWSNTLILTWAVNPDASLDSSRRLIGKIPPVCLWSGPAINRFFNLSKSENQRVSDNAVNQAIGRDLKLFWPAPALRFKLQESTRNGKQTLRFVRGIGTDAQKPSCP